MRINHLTLVATLTFLWAATHAQAHHSWARYDGEHLITVSGVITKLEWTSPHVFVYFDATDERGTVTSWTMELDPPVLLRRYGVVREMLNEGAAVTITGVGARSGVPMMRGLRIELADGTDLRVSSRI